MGSTRVRLNLYGCEITRNWVIGIDTEDARVERPALSF